MAIAKARRARAKQATKEHASKLVQGGATIHKMSYEHTSQQPPGVQLPLVPSVSLENSQSLRAIAEPEIGVKKRKTLKGKIPAEIRRSSSTPHIRGLALSDASALSPTDKRRNKLGYHRTSVACGHCRRRKIRCLLPSPEDPNGRCANCIRLKKECNFYPVDQPIASEQRLPGMIKPETTYQGDQSVSSQSSPRVTAPAQIGPIPTELAQFAQPGTQVHREPGSPAYGAHLVNGAHFPPAQYGIPTPPPRWSSSTPTGHNPHQNPQVPTYWNPAQPPTDYSGPPELPSHHVDALPHEAPHYPFQHAGQSWGVPTRSMSFGNIEGMHQHYPYHEPHPPHGVPHPEYQYNDPRGAPDSGSDQQLPAVHFSYQKPWAPNQQGANYSSAGEHQQPIPAQSWHPQPPPFINSVDRPYSTSYEHSRLYPQASNPG